MQVVRAQNAGACYGVQRALDLAEQTITDGMPATTLGPLIHNPLVVEDLAARGICVADDVASVTTPAVLVRSHGVTPEVLDAARASGLSIIDATCPHVARAQKAAAHLAEEGRLVVVVGEAGHPEVEGLRAYARRSGGRVVVAGGPDDIPEGIYDPVGVVVQTTQMRSALDTVVECLRLRGLDPEVCNTICYATTQRQTSAAELACQVDAMVVIGGRNSSNTTRLADICRERCPRSYHIETPDEIDSHWFDGCDSIGVTAGASTPEAQIDAVVSMLEAIR